MSVRAYYPIARAILQVVFDGFGDDAKNTPPKVIHVLPISVTVHRNSYRQADSWEITCDVNDLPIDPQLVRAGAVEIYLFQQPADQHDQRVLSRELATSDDPSSLSGSDWFENAIRETDQQRERRLVNDNPPMVAGLFDEMNMELSEDGKQLTISGQDYTALLAAKQWPPTANRTARRIPTGKRLDRTLEAILAEADTEGRLALRLEGVTAADMPVVGAKEANANKRGIPVEESTSYWDVMYKLATRYGFILFVRGVDVVLAAPKNIDLATVQPKKLAWGNNLMSLRLSRHLGKEKVPRLVLQGYDPVSRKNITVEYPSTGLSKAAKTKLGLVGFKPSAKATQTEKKSSAATKKPTAARAAPLKLQDEFEFVPIFGATDETTLRRMAETLYHLRGHAERKMIAVTHDMRDMRESSLMDLATGDPVEVDWDDFNREMITNPNVSPEAKRAHLVSRGFNAEVAQVIAQSYDRLLSQNRPMRVKEVTYEYDADEGITIEMELQDFVVVDGNRSGNTHSRAARSGG